MGTRETESLNQPSRGPVLMITWVCTQAHTSPQVHLSPQRSYIEVGHQKKTVQMTPQLSTFTILKTP